MLNKKRWKNHGLWFAAASLVADVLVYSNVIDIPQDQVEMILQRVFEVLVLAGIISNPTKPDSKGFNF